MCGVAGIAHADGRPVDRDVVRAMTRAIAHRGPDDEGFHFAAGIGLGHRRLSIIDLSADGHQPMSNEDGSVWVAFNGEIYNFLELRERLVARGHRFRSRSDTEVLVHLYEERGAALVDELRGMFAFALWDANRRYLLLARDRIGIKPMFVAELPDGLRFGSEVKAVLADPRVPRDLDDQALDGYLAQNYVTAPSTLLRAVRQLEPGEYLEYGGGAGARRRRYWDLQFPPPPVHDERAWTDLVETSLRDALRSHLMADVPYGALLSGGLDSATLVGMLVQEHRAKTVTFTADFEESTFGEGAQARRAATALGAENHQVLFSPPTLQSIEKVVHHADEPTADMSMLPFIAVCELARRHVKVVLSGEGADEVFAGYATYPASLVGGVYRSVPAPARAAIRTAIERLPDRESKVSRTEKLKRFVRGVEAPPAEMHLSWRQICSADLRRELHPNGSYDSASPATAVLHRSTARRPLDRLLHIDLAHYLPNDMLVKADRMSMAHGLELRVPYLDHRFVELAATVPPGLKLRRLTTGKWILRRIADRVLPRAARPPRRKLGFNVPFGAWARGPLRDVVGDLLSPARIARQGLLRPEIVTRLFDEHQRGIDRTYELYSLVVLSVWSDQTNRAASRHVMRVGGAT